MSNALLAIFPMDVVEQVNGYAIQLSVSQRLTNGWKAVHDELALGEWQLMCIDDETLSEASDEEWTIEDEGPEGYLDWELENRINRLVYNTNDLRYAGFHDPR